MTNTAKNLSADQQPMSISDHCFTGPSFTIGIEEELMILDAKTLELANAIGDILERVPVGLTGAVKPELMESVLEISTDPCANTGEAGEQLRELRRVVRTVAESIGLTVGSSGTHPTAKWEDQRIVSDDRYRSIIEDLAIVARQELIFGMHVHVGIDDPEKAIHVANGMRVHVPILLALSANSPFWRTESTGMASSRTPIFRAFPRVGIPPRYENYSDYVERVSFMQAARVVDDYTFLWYDVRPHPRLGTVEIRVMDSQTRVADTLGLAALVQAMVKELSEHFEDGKKLSRYPFELLDENKWLAARHGLKGELIDLPRSVRVPATELATRLVDRLRPHALELGSEAEFEQVGRMIREGNGAAEQERNWDANHDMHQLLEEIVAVTAH